MKTTSRAGAREFGRGKFQSPVLGDREAPQLEEGKAQLEEQSGRGRWLDRLQRFITSQ